MGLAVLPARLKDELELLKTYILEKKDIRSNETIAKHADWTESFLPSYPEINAENVTHILEQGSRKGLLSSPGRCRCLQMHRRRTRCI